MLTGAFGGAGLLSAGFATAGSARLITRMSRPDLLRSATVAFTSGTDRDGIESVDARRLPAHSRVIPDLVDPRPARRQQAFLERCAPWLEGLPVARRDLALSALLDLWVLTDSLPATVASWSRPWRLIWPRDTAFSAVALARVGAVDLAWAQLLHLQSLQSGNGSFAARFSPSGGIPPDDRASQFDSIGLLLWAVAEVVRSAANSNQAVVLSQMMPMLKRSAQRLLTLTENGRALPPVTPDYWEVAESQVTLGIAGPTLIGLRSLQTLSADRPDLFAEAAEPTGRGRDVDSARIPLDARMRGVDGGAERIRESAEAFAGTFMRTFGANGLQRYPTSGGFDSAIAYLPATGLGLSPAGSDLPAVGPGLGPGPGPVRLPDLERVWDRLEQPGGGIKPGHGWIFDHSSWTPSTSLMALGYARLGAHDRAGTVLDWLADHRTAAGSLPEKVSSEGAPVSVAPLSWTASNVILCLDELSGSNG